MTPRSSTPDDTPLSASLVALLACGAGLSAAGIYYNQPILGALAADLRVTPAQIGLVPMLTQLGYAAGIVLFAPIGDRFDRRRVITVKAILLCLALLLAALAPAVGWLYAASLMIGLSATLAQDFVPAAASLAPAAARGKIVGTVMTGLLLGILLSRLISGVVADHLGWRAMFFAAAASIALLAIVSAVRLPPLPGTTRESYGALLRSMAALARDLEPLRRAALTQALLSVAFSCFWSTLALVLHAAPYHLGSTAAGAFGLAGAVGALAAPVAGSIADRRGPRAVIRLGAALVLGAFLLMTAVQGSLLILIVGAVIFDLGVQASLISNQTIVYSLDPSARSRLNAVLVSSMFIGMALGAALASYALAHHGWTGVCLSASLAAAAALGISVLPTRG